MKKTRTKNANVNNNKKTNQKWKEKQTNKKFNVNLTKMCWEFHNVQLRYISFNMWYLVVSVLHMVKSCILNMVFAAVVVFFIVWKLSVSFAIGHRETIQMNLSNCFLR